MLPHLRPMHTGEILDGAFRLHRLHVRAFLAAEVVDVRLPADRPAPAAA